jgi:hypothetical protein
MPNDHFCPEGGEIVFGQRAAVCIAAEVVGYSSRRHPSPAGLVDRRDDQNRISSDIRRKV